MKERGGARVRGVRKNTMSESRGMKQEKTRATERVDYRQGREWKRRRAG